MPHLDAWRWIAVIVGSIGLGVAKTGIPGIGILMIALFTTALPGRFSIGVVLPLLIAADIVAVTTYRRHADWRHLRGLLPAAALGVVLGWRTIATIPDRVVAPAIGIILIVLVILQFWRKRRSAAGLDEAERTPTAFWFMACVGVLAGFTTMVANAAGPIMILYLLAARLPKMEFVGTGAWFYFLINLFKAPFSAQAGLISAASCTFDVILIPFSVAGALAGRRILGRIDQSLFESIALALTLVAALRLVVPW